MTTNETTTTPSNEIASTASNETTTPAPVVGMLFEEPFNAIQPEMNALSPAELVPITIDVLAAAITVLGVQSGILAFQDSIAKLPDFDVGLPAKLSVYAMALSHADTLWSMASAPASAIKPLSDEGVALRETLFADASTLVVRKLMDGNQLKDLKGPVGYKNLAHDLQVLVQAFRNSMETVQGKCATTPAELLRAEQIAALLMKLVGIQEQGPANAAAASDVRNRAFTLFINAYDQIRRALIYLRWKQNDVEKIAPSLYLGRGGGKKTTDVPSPTPPAPGPTPQTPPAPPATPAPAGTVPPHAVTNEVATSASGEAVPTNGAKTGPRASPFLSRADLDS
jgi:hypothetical protein